MTKTTPQAPPAGRNPHENKDHRPHEAEKTAAENAKVSGHDKHLDNVKEQGDQANIAQNTRNPGHQQNR